jgi:hypothetical protein
VPGSGTADTTIACPLTGVVTKVAVRAIVESERARAGSAPVEVFQLAKL